MALFDFFKRETPKETIDLDKEAARIAAIYETYPEFPVMSADRDVDAWLEEIANGSAKIVPREHMTRNEDGLLPGEVLLLDWVNEKDSTFTDFPDFFEMDFGIDPAETTNQLLFSDYLDILNEPSVLEFWSLTQLNDVLEENGLTICSDKKQAITKIKKEFSKDYITNMIDPGIYVLMEKGQKIVEKYTDFIHGYLDTPPE